MTISIFYKNISSDAPLEEFINQKIGGLDKFFKDPNGLAEIRVEVGKPSKHHRSGEIYYVEINLKIGGKLLRATCQHEDLRNAIVDARNELGRQVKKLKEKRTDQVRKIKIQ